MAKPQILCLDDEPKNLKLYEAMLLPNEFEVIKAENGPEALELISKEKIDLILLDVMMPGMDGFEVCRSLKSDPATASIPIVIITALSDKESLNLALQAGTSLFLTKPIWVLIWR
ncbi:MAG: response regulator [Nitrospirae bacterium]|nr:response regulator [Nitrospirota bacterium]